MYVDIHLDAGDLKLTLSGVCNGFIDHHRPPKLKRPYIPPTQFTHAPRRMGRNPRRRNAVRTVTGCKDDSSGDDVPHTVYHGCTFNIVNSEPVLAGELAAMKAELEQARQEKAALQAELEMVKAELEKARQAEGVNPKSRNTYLKVIAALANRSGKIGLHERGAAVTISRATEIFGFPVSEDTTRKIIKEIDEMQR